MMRNLFFAFLTLFGMNALAQDADTSIHRQTFLYAVKDSSRLELDLYSTGNILNGNKKPCVIFVFGGAFVGGHRDDTAYNRYFSALASNNYVVISISYRLGLKGVTNLSKFNIKPLRNAIDLAVDDLFDATRWTIDHAADYNIDTTLIILSGSSSGAITVLNADFKKNNDQAPKLSPGFRYAGIVAFSGAILSYNGSLKYKTAPAPTMMFHGTADQIVPYNKIRFFNRGFYGSSSIANTFRENKYPYFIYREEGLGHEVALLPMYYSIPEILDFLDKFVKQGKKYQVDLSFDDEDRKPLLTMSAKELFEKLNR
jgi:predicted esterase